MKKPAIALVLMAVLLMSFPFSSLAASGGRMGGRARSSHHSPSSSHCSYSSYSYRPYRSFYAYPPYRSWSSTSSCDSNLSWNSTSSSGSPSSPSDSDSPLLALVVILLSIVFLCWLFSDSKETTTVLKLQVGVSASARSLQRDLNEIASCTNASTPNGLSCILTDTTLAVLRHPKYFVSAFSSIDQKARFKDSEKRFNELSIEERVKLDEETLVNVNDLRRHRLVAPSCKRDDGCSSNECIVITILVEAEGSHKLPRINRCKDLEVALRKLGSTLSRQIRAVEVIWTPQTENGTLSEKQVVEDYPLLRPILI